MDKRISLSAPLHEYSVAGLSPGDGVFLNGIIYSARDAAHAKLAKLLAEGKALPFDIRGQIIYYTGPTPGRNGRPVGAAGPTTASRMDPWTKALLAAGLKGMVGKGNRSPEVRETIRRHGAIYFVAVGGAGALLGKKIKKAEVIAYPELGTEAVRLLEVEDFPATVAIDTQGRSIFSGSAAG